MKREAPAKPVRVFFLPGVRRVYVYFGKVVAPTSPDLHRPEYVRYRVSAPEFVVMFLVAVLASLQLAPLIGLLSAFFLASTAWFILYASNRRKKYLLERLRQELPEQVVVDAVRRGFGECGRGDRLTVTVETESAVFDVACGRPGKCVEYDRGRVKIFTAVVGSTAAALITAYVLVPDLVPYTLAPLIVVLVLLSKYNLCRSYSVVPVVRS